MEYPDPSPNALFAALSPQTRFPSKKPSGMSETEWLRQQQDNRTREFFKGTMSSPVKTDLEEILPQRCFCAWRITREIARSNNMISFDEPLALVMEEFWYEPKETQSRNDALDPVALDMWEDTFSWPDRYGIIVPDTSPPKVRSGLSLQPPPLCPAYEGDEEYSPRKDRLLTRWREIITRIGEVLGTYSPTPDFPNLAQEGMGPLTNPETSRQAWPSPLQIVAMETLMIEEVLGLLVNESRNKVKKILRETYGLHKIEINQLMAMAMAEAGRTLDHPVEEDRGLMALRLEDFCSRAKDSADLRAELAGLKQLSVVLGLARVDPKDSMSEIMNVISEVSKERKLVANTAAPEGATGEQGELINEPASE